MSGGMGRRSERSIAQPCVIRLEHTSHTQGGRGFRASLWCRASDAFLLRMAPPLQQMSASVITVYRKQGIEYLHLPSAYRLPATWCISGSPFGYSPALALHCTISVTNLFFVGSFGGNARSSASNFAIATHHQPPATFSPPHTRKESTYPLQPHPPSSPPSPSHPQACMTSRHHCHLVPLSVALRRPREGHRWRCPSLAT